MQIGSVSRIHPFARLLLFYFSGLLCGSALKPEKAIWIWMLFFLISVLLIALIWISARPYYNTHRNSGVIASTILIIAGLLNYSIFSANSSILIENTGSSGTVVMRITEPGIKTKKALKFTAIISPVNQNESIIHQQKILAYLACDSSAARLEPGDRIVCEVKLNRIPGPMNPYEFDYSKYLAGKNIFHQCYLPSSSWNLLPDEKIPVRTLSFRFQQILLAKYHQIGLNPTLFAVLSAVTLGYKNDLDVHTRQAFSKAGVMHVMALSGFNVAVIAFALNYLLFFLGRIPFSKTIIIILFIWFFAFITGLSPSVTRASLMISLVFVGKEIHRNLKVANILYASAFILLTVSPGLIADVSFQLSFAAVFGIIIFHPPLNNIFHFGNKISERIWQLFTVSLAAQLATMPLTIYYFHQFPVYFWITNLYVVPLVSVIICAAGIFLMVSFIQPLMFLTGKVLALLVTLLFKTVIFIEVMPFSVIQNIRIDSFQLMLLIVLLVISAFYIYQRRTLHVLCGLMVVVILQISAVVKTYSLNRQQFLMVGHLKNSSIIYLVNGRNSLSISDAVIEDDNPLAKYSFGNFWIRHGLSGERMKSKILPRENLIFTFGGRQIMILNESDLPEKTRAVDVLIITGRVNAEAVIINAINPHMVITDSSVPLRKSDQWTAYCTKVNIPCWNVTRQGACTIHNNMIQKHSTGRPQRAGF